jgi:hypothetical protein
MNTQSEQIGRIELESIFQLTILLRKDYVDAWKESITSIITFLKKLKRFFMSEKGVKIERMFLKEEEGCGNLFTRNTDASLLYTYKI